RVELWLILHAPEAERAAGCPGHFDRPNDSPHIACVYCFCTCRIDSPQLLEERVCASRGGRLFELCPERRIGRDARHPPRLEQRRQRHARALIDAAAPSTRAPKLSAFKDAPPMSPPSMSGCAMNSATLAGVTEPPYRMRT